MRASDFPAISKRIGAASVRMTGRGREVGSSLQTGRQAMFQSNGLLSQIAARLSGRGSSAPQENLERAQTPRRARWKPAGWGECTGLGEDDDRKDGVLRDSTMHAPRTLHHDNHANAATEEVPLWFGWWQ